MYIQVEILGLLITSVDIHLHTRKINKDLPVPFYYQMVEILREVIQDSKATSDQREVTFPSESELAEFFQVNRGTVRHALEVLEREGLIYREKGRGTFVRRRRVELDLTSLCSTTEDLKARGWTPGSQLLDLAQIAPSPHIQRALDLQPGTAVWQIHRLRLANEEPISLQWSYIPADIAPGLDQHNLTGSLYYTLRNAYRIELREGDQTIRTRAATLKEANLLQIAEGDAVFEISRITYDQSRKPVEYLDSLWRGDRYDLRVHLFSKQDPIYS